MVKLLFILLEHISSNHQTDICNWVELQISNKKWERKWMEWNEMKWKTRNCQKKEERDQNHLQTYGSNNLFDFQHPECSIFVMDKTNIYGIFTIVECLQLFKTGIVLSSSFKLFSIESFSCRVWRVAVLAIYYNRYTTQTFHQYWHSPTGSDRLQSNRFCRVQCNLNIFIEFSSAFHLLGSRSLSQKHAEHASDKHTQSKKEHCQ